MTIFKVTRSDQPIIGLPENLLQALNLREGEQIALTVPHAPRRVSQEAMEAFLALEGILADAPEFETIMQEIREVLSFPET